MEVRLVAAMDTDPVMMQVSKVDDKPFVALTKNNHDLHRILRKGVANEYTKKWIRNLPYTNILEQLKQLKDAKYAEALSHGPKSKRARSYKSFILQLSNTCEIEAPSVSDITGITIRVLLSCLAFNECRCFGVFVVCCSLAIKLSMNWECCAQYCRHSI